MVVISPYEEQRSRIEEELKRLPHLRKLFKNQTIVYCIDGYQVTLFSPLFYPPLLLSSLPLANMISGPRSRRCDHVPRSVQLPRIVGIPKEEQQVRIKKKPRKNQEITRKKTRKKQEKKRS